MRQTLTDKDGNVIWTNSPPERPDGKPSGTGAGTSPWRTRPTRPDQEAQEDFTQSEKAAHLKTFRGFNAGRPRGR
jgi:hypothetical protein